jgi:putative endonuclease
MAVESRWFLYVLRCADDTLYTGIARDVSKRVMLHESGKGAKYTRGRGPFSILVTRRCNSHSLALRLERAVKRLSRAEKELLVRGRRLAAFARRIEAEGQA